MWFGCEQQFLWGERNVISPKTAAEETIWPGASKFCSWASENRSSVAQWASESSLSSLVSLNENVSLINDNFQSEAISKLKTTRLVNH